MAAFDDLYPEQTSTATIDINMIRNENRPRWNNEVPLRITISETLPMGAIVTSQINATDLDRDVIQYTATADEETLRFFYLDPDTARVTVKSPLYPYQGSKTSYSVNVESKILILSAFKTITEATIHWAVRC